MGVMQRALTLIYPNQCILCVSLVESRGALCGECWRETVFLNGHTCDLCGASLPGQSDGSEDFCDDCILIKRPWVKGRAALSYVGAGKRLTLALKHGDRTDLALPAAKWMARAGASFLDGEMLIVPVPSHWTRRVSRRYNQAAELSRAVSNVTGLAHRPDVLVRRRKTQIQDGMSAEARFLNMKDGITAHPRHRRHLKGRNVCLVDDVMTSGATLEVASEACRAAGADQIFVLILARVEKTP